MDTSTTDKGPYAPPNDFPSSNLERAKNPFRSQTLLVTSMYAVLAGASVFSIFYYENLIANYSASVAFALLATAWAVNDSRLRGGTFHPVLRMLYLFACPISPVLYLVFTRGFRGIGLAALHAFGLTAVVNAAFYGTYYAIYFSGFWELYDPVFFER